MMTNELTADKNISQADKNISQAVVEKLVALPLEKQQEILDFVEFLYQKFHQADTAPADVQTKLIWGWGQSRSIWALGMRQKIMMRISIVLSGALHNLAAIAVQAEELVLKGRSTKLMHRATQIKIISIS